MNTKILIIEDDIGIANSLQLYIQNSGFEVEIHTSGIGAIEKILHQNFDLIILDINLPGINGIEICTQVRLTSQIPIIMLTARNSEIDRVKGLENGADDYVSKPFSPRELLARIHTILRRAQSSFSNENTSNQDTLIFKNICIDTKKFIVTVDKKEVSLTKNEFDILKKLMEEDGNIVKRETLMTDVIGYDNYAFDRTIDTHIKNLRKKLNIKDSILTIRGEGYRMNK